ncbi:MAG: DinB family protein, partial [Saprospiraceae bacterium]
MKTAILRKYERYDQHVRSFLDALAQYPDEQLNRKPAGGGWSAMQVLHHLLLTEELSMAYIRKKLSYNPSLEKVGLGSHWRTFLLHAFLRSPVKFKAPAMIGDSNLPDFATLAETRARW